MGGSSRMVAGLEVFVGTAVVLSLTACGSPPPPRAELEVAQTSVQEARQADAPEHAPGPFVLAEDKLKRAQDAFEKGDYTSARRLAEESAVDAKFAEAATYSAIADARVAELKKSIQILREELQRQQPGT